MWLYVTVVYKDLQNNRHWIQPCFPFFFFVANSKVTKNSAFWMHGMSYWQENPQTANLIKQVHALAPQSLKLIMPLKVMRQSEPITLLGMQQHSTDNFRTWCVSRCYLVKTDLWSLFFKTDQRLFSGPLPGSKIDFTLHKFTKLSAQMTSSLKKKTQLENWLHVGQLQ